MKLNKLLMLIILFFIFFVINNNEEENLNYFSNKIYLNSYVDNKPEMMLLKKTQYTSKNVLISLEVPKIKLIKNIYNYNSKLNDVDKNVTILYPSKFDINSTIVLTAHSGNSKVSYFKNLDKLKLLDVINLFYNKHKYNYKIIAIYEIDKNYELKIDDNKVLYLTTCSQTNKDKQLVIEAKLNKVY